MTPRPWPTAATTRTMVSHLRPQIGAVPALPTTASYIAAAASQPSTFRGPFGINDAGQIVGLFYDSSGNPGICHNNSGARRLPTLRQRPRCDGMASSSQEENGGRRVLGNSLITSVSEARGVLLRSER